MNGSVIMVPIHLDALLLSEDALVTEAVANFSKLPFSSASGDQNPDNPFLGETIHSEPFHNTNFNLKKGLHLHWSLPDALTKGKSSGIPNDYPAVPDRWFVTRKRGETVVKQWIVESNYLHPIGRPNGGTSYPLDVSEGQPFRYLGRQLAYEGWKEDVEAERLEKLTALGYGEPSFAAFYPNCHSVFGFYDEEVFDQEGLEDLSYQVIGWYSDWLQDPVCQLGKKHLSKDSSEILMLIGKEFGWSVSGSAESRPEAMACYAEIEFTPSGVIDNQKRRQVVEVSVGYTGPEALAAHLAGELSSANKDLVEEQLVNVLLQSSLNEKELDFAHRFKEARHENGFQAETGGILRVIEPRKNEDRYVPSQIIHPPNLSRLVSQLNDAQKNLDQDKNKLAHLRHLLFSSWYKYMLARYPEHVVQHDYPDIDLISHTIAHVELPEIKDVQDSISQHEREVSDLQRKTYNLLGNFNISRTSPVVDKPLNQDSINIDGLIFPKSSGSPWEDNAPFSEKCVGLNGQQIKVTNLPADIEALSMWVHLAADHSRDAVLMAAGNKVVLIGTDQEVKPWKRLTINAQDVSVNQKLRWRDFPKEQWIHVYIEFTDKVSLDSEIELFGCQNSSFLKGKIAGFRLFKNKLSFEEVYWDLNMLKHQALDLKTAPGPRFWQPKEPVILLEGAAAEPSLRHGHDSQLSHDGLLPCHQAEIQRSNGAYVSPSSVTVSSKYSNVYNPENVSDPSDASSWMAPFNSGKEEWLQVTFAVPYKANYLFMNSFTGKNMRLQGSHDGTTWIVLKELTKANSNTMVAWLDHDESYLHYRYFSEPDILVILGTMRLGYFERSYIGTSALAPLTEHLSSIKPQTPDVTNSAEPTTLVPLNVDVSTVYSESDSYKADNLIDGDVNTFWLSQINSGEAGWIQIDAAGGYVSNVIQVMAFSEAHFGINPKLEGSHDGSGWKLITTIHTTDAYKDENDIWVLKCAFENTTSYKYYRYTSEPCPLMVIKEISFSFDPPPALPQLEITEVLASSAPGINSLPGNATDNDPDSFWMSRSKSGETEWLEIAYNRPAVMNHVRIIGANIQKKNIGVNPVIQGSSDRNNWTTIAEISTQNLSRDEEGRAYIERDLVNYDEYLYYRYYSDPCDVLMLSSLELSFKEEEDISESIGFHSWDQQPWHPLFLEWEVEVLPMLEGGNHDGDHGTYAPDFIHQNFVLKEHRPELRVESNKKVGQIPAFYTGRSILTPHANKNLQINLLNELNGLLEASCYHVIGDIPDIEEVNYRKKLSEWFAEKPLIPGHYRKTSEMMEAVRFYKNWYLEKWVYQGELKTFNTVFPFEESKLKDFNYTLITAFEHLITNHHISQSLGGFNAGLLMHHQTLEVPIKDPLAFDHDQELVDQIKEVLDGHTRMANEPLGSFIPFRSGVLRIHKLHLIDTFGQVKSDLNLESLVKAKTMSLPDEPVANTLPNDAWLAPGFVQPARINFRWMETEEDDREMGTLADGPIHGWLMANHLDHSLAIYDRKGEGLGIISQDAVFRPQAGMYNPVDLEDIDVHLRKIIVRLSTVDQEDDELERAQKVAFLQGFLVTLDSALETTHPENRVHHNEIAVLMGRPVAVTRAFIKLELKEDPVVHHGWMAYRHYLDHGHHQTDAFEDIQVPLRIGDQDRLNDGLVGYWKELEEGALDQYFYSTAGILSDRPGAGVGSPNILYHQATEPVLSVSTTDDPLNMTMLVDPVGEVHVTSGVLPVKSIRIPRGQYTDALKNIKITFLSTPIISGRNEIAIPLPSEPGYEWSWLEKERFQWLETSGNGVVRKEIFRVHFEDAVVIWNELLERGWIEKIDPNRAVVVPIDQRLSAALSKEFTKHTGQIQELLDNSMIKPVSTDARFDQKQMIKEGWLCLSPEKTK